MQKLKKALKKLAGIKTRAAQPAKKSAPAKKKSQPVAAKAKAAKPAKAAAGKAKAAKPAKAAAKPKAEESKKKTATAKPAKAAEKAAKPAKASVAPIRASKPEKKAATPTAKKTTEKSQSEVEEEVAAEAQTEAQAGAKSAEPKAAKAAKAPKAADEEAEVRAEEVPATPAADVEVYLTDAEGRRYCRVKDCDQLASVDAYCRYHYLLFWKNIQNRKKILSEGKLERYIEELTARYPDKYLELLRKDLRSEKDFTAAIQELEIDESSTDSEFEDEAQSYLDEVRGMSSEQPTREEEEF